ncbi:MAG: hypothetical protein H6737_19185 [Alphaproteobacteria bacterium]|nr:hypothetical protein [Alphaproteobacteria bacterium]
MRTAWMTLLLTGCVLGERQTTYFEPGPELLGSNERFARMAETQNPGYGIVPAVEGIDAWMGMGDRICEVRGNSGTIATDIFVDGDLAPGVVLLDGSVDGWLAADGSTLLVTGAWGDIVASYDLPGEILGGVFGEDGIYVLVATDDGCVVFVIAADGTITEIPVEDEVCDPDTDIEPTAEGILLGGGPEILEITPVGVQPVAEGSQVAADPTTGLVYTGTPGVPSLVVHHPDGHTQVVGLPSGLIDFSARGGTLVALTEGWKLVEIDTTTHNPVAVEPYFGPTGISRLQLSGDGEGIVLTSSRTVQFYRLRETRGAAGSPPPADGGGDDALPSRQGM